MIKELFFGKSDKSTSYYFKKLIVARKLTHYSKLMVATYTEQKQMQVYPN